MQNSKLKKLHNILKNLKSIVVAYSGGLDSTFLLKAAVDALGNRKVLAVTARSETYPLSEYKDAVKMVKLIDARHLTIRTSELKIKGFKDNPVNRCYYCKRELFKELKSISKARGLANVVDGTNYDDLKDIRYGRKAAAELGIKSPLLEAGITKSDIRKFSKRLKLATWNKPSFACLASRVPFKSEITKIDLNRIDKAEDYLKSLGFDQVRVRLHKDTARIEVPRKDFALAIKFNDKITKRLKDLGFVYATLDLAGYRTGSMHEAM